MTLHQATLPAARTRSATHHVVLVATGAGITLGVVDLLLQLTLPYPWADLANSSAVWAVAALLLARFLAVGDVRSAAAGVVTLVVAVEAYYVAAILLDKAGAASLVAPTTIAWMVMGVVTGAGFGVAGAWTRRGETWQAAAGYALGVAVLLAEAWARADWTGTALLTAGLGAALLATVVRRPALLVRTVLLTIILAPVCLALFDLAGFAV